MQAVQGEKDIVFNTFVIIELWLWSLLGLNKHIIIYSREKLYIKTSNAYSKHKIHVVQDTKRSHNVYIVLRC